MRRRLATRAWGWGADILASHFEKSVRECYVDSPRPPPLGWRYKERAEVAGVAQSCEIADVRGCRKSALEFNVRPVPVFSPLDRVEPVEDCVLGDINYVDRPQTDVVRQLDYTPGWQHRVQTELLLHMGSLVGATSSTGSRPRRTTQRTSSGARCASWRRPGKAWAPCCRS